MATFYITKGLRDRVKIETSKRGIKIQDFVGEAIEASLRQLNGKKIKPAKQ